MDGMISSEVEKRMQRERKKKKGLPMKKRPQGRMERAKWDVVCWKMMYQQLVKMTVWKRLEKGMQGDERWLDLEIVHWVQMTTMLLLLLLLLLLLHPG
jgi:hypothetical protein